MDNFDIAGKESAGKSRHIARNMIIAGVVLLAAGAVWYGISGRSYSTKTIDVNETFSGADINNIVIDSGSAKLTVTKSSDDMAHITGTDVPDGSEASVKGGKLEVRNGRKRGVYFFVSFGDLKTQPEWVVELPDKEYDTMFLDSGSGSSVIDDIKLKGKFTADAGSGAVRLTGLDCEKAYINSGSGSIELNEVNSKGDVAMDGGSGGILVDGMECGKLKLDTGSGSSSFTGVTSKGLIVNGGSGDMEYSGAVNGDISIDGGSGDCTLDLTNPQSDFGSKYSLRTDEGSGKITINYGK